MSMFYLIISILVALFFAIWSEVIIERYRSKNTAEKNDMDLCDTASGSECNSGSDAVQHHQSEKSKSLKSILKNLKVFDWLTIFGGILAVGFVSYYLQVVAWNQSSMDWLGISKLVVAAIIMMAAALVDLYTKKIPNIFSLIFLLVGTVCLIIEFFVMKDSFVTLAIFSMIGLIGSFLLLLIMSLVTRGGIGMGDVKLISTMGFVTGIATTFYTFLFANIACLITTLFLLLTKKKKMKDELPFGPFLFVGYVLVIILCRF